MSEKIKIVEWDGNTDSLRKQVHDLSVASYQKGYKEGFIDACKQIGAVSQELAESANEVLEDK